MSKKPADANGSPKSYGYKAEGACYDVLRGKGLQCDVQTVRATEGQAGGWLAEARKIGFVTYICETAGGATREYPLSTLVPL